MELGEKVSKMKKMEHISAGLLVICNEKILLVQQANDIYKEHLSIPKGQINKNEKPLDAAVRETYEETGVVCKPLMKFGERNHPDFPVQLHYWLNEYVTGEAYVKDDEELDEIKWCNSKEIFELITSNLYEKIKEYLEMN